MMSCCSYATNNFLHGLINDRCRVIFTDGAHVAERPRDAEPIGINSETYKLQYTLNQTRLVGYGYSRCS